jgi:hypothetical protein
VTGIGLIIAVGRGFCPLLGSAMRARTTQAGFATSTWPRPARGGEVDVLQRAAQVERHRIAVTVSIPRFQPPDVVEGATGFWGG